jgi:hypothetical protein
MPGLGVEIVALLSFCPDWSQSMILRIFVSLVARNILFILYQASTHHLANDNG